MYLKLEKSDSVITSEWLLVTYVLERTNLT